MSPAAIVSSSSVFCDVPVGMRLFSRNKEAVQAVHADDVPFEALRRSPRNIRKPRGTTGSSSNSDFDASAPLDPAQASKTRARRRLIGAVALALAAIVFVPMLFDRAPVAPVDDIGLQIPDRDSPFEGRRGVPDPNKGPLRPSSELPAAVSGTPAATVVEAPAAPAPDTKLPPAEMAAEADKPATVTAEPPAKAATLPVLKTAEKPASAPVAKTAEKPVDKPKPATSQAADDPRALAALTGKTEAPTAAEPANGRGYAVQIAAYSAADRARVMRDQLVSNGLKSYTEPVSTAQGQRTRVRLGPFATREAAERAKQKLRTMKLDGSVVPL